MVNKEILKLVEELLSKTSFGTIEIKVQDGEVLYVEQRPVFRRVVNQTILIYS